MSSMHPCAQFNARTACQSPNRLQQALVTNVGLDDEVVAEATLDIG
ncbi:hypothetical protein [Microvirga sp. VF16]|nr:hypothetical protein [Microvirga sp. VF16]QRM34326.1 hypothetical protein JO965_34495 [Microvirga sp. VF16]